MGMTFLGGENPPGVSTQQRVDAFRASASQRTWYQPVHLRGHDTGGHFGPWENPGAVIADIRDTFRPLG